MVISELQCQETKRIINTLKGVKLAVKLFAGGKTATSSSGYCTLFIVVFTSVFGPLLELRSLSIVSAKSTAGLSPHKMLIEEDDAADLKTWVVKRLENMCVRIHC